MTSLQVFKPHNNKANWIIESCMLSNVRVLPYFQEEMMVKLEKTMA